MGPAPATNMVVIVCGEGDERLFRPEHGKPDMLVTFVLLQAAAVIPAAARAARGERARASPICS